MNKIYALKEKIKESKILFVDDEKRIRESTKQFLNKFFNQVITCKNGKEGLDTFLEHTDIKMVISDIQMPKLDGVDMAKKIKEINPNTIIIFVSASRDEYEVEEGLCTKYITKPITYNTIINLLEELKEHL